MALGWSARLLILRSRWAVSCDSTDAPVAPSSAVLLGGGSGLARGPGALPLDVLLCRLGQGVAMLEQQPGG
jgi:hypothetical protein